MGVNFLELLASLGALQGGLLLLVVVLRFRGKKNIPLALLILVFSLRLGTIPSWNSATLLQYPWVYPLTAPLPFLFGPLLWWYARALVRDHGAPPRPALHFLPYLAELIAVTVTVCTLREAEYTALIERIFEGSPPVWLPVRNGIKVAVNLGYVVAIGILAFGRAGAHVSRRRKRWLRTLTFIPPLSLVPFAFVAVYSPASAQLAGGAGGPFLILAGAMGVLIYALTVMVMVAPEEPACPADEGGRGGTQPEENPPSFSARRIVVTASERKPAGTLSPEDCKCLAERASARLEAGAYKDPELTEARLAAKLGVHANRLSAAINYTYSGSFRSVLNRRRLRCFTETLSANPERERTILEIAYGCGFPSKTTFNRVFKEVYGVAPSIWFAELRRSTEKTGILNDEP
mgnify:CR=1 FL=1